MPVLMYTFIQHKWDSVGSLRSILCLIHCLVLPAAAALLPATLLLNESAHVALVFVLTPVALKTVWDGFHKHRQILPGAAIVAGLLVVGIAAFTAFTESLEVVLISVGSLALLAGHIHNGYQGREPPFRHLTE